MEITRKVKNNPKRILGLELYSGFSKHAFHDVPFGLRTGTVPGATLLASSISQEPSKISPKKRRIARFLLRSASQCVQSDRTRDSPFPAENALKTFLVVIQTPKVPKPLKISKRRKSDSKVTFRVPVEVTQQ